MDGDWLTRTMSMPWTSRAESSIPSLLKMQRMPWRERLPESVSSPRSPDVILDAVVQMLGNVVKVFVKKREAHTTNL
jgi:hypothetical protein